MSGKYVTLNPDRVNCRVGRQGRGDLRRTDFPVSRELLQRWWLVTKTWLESHDFLKAHPGLVSDPRTLAALQAALSG